MSFHLNSPVKGFTSVGILALARSTSACVKILTSPTLSAKVPITNTKQISIPIGAGRNSPIGLRPRRKLRHSNRRPNRTRERDDPANTNYSRQFSPNITIRPSKKENHIHIHPPPPRQSMHPIQPRIHRRHQEPRKQRPNRRKYLNQAIPPRQLMRLVIARTDVHHRREVAGFE